MVKSGSCYISSGLLPPPPDELENVYTMSDTAAVLLVWIPSFALYVKLSEPM